MIENLFRENTPASAFSNPPGQSTPLMVTGMKSFGVQAPTFRSNVSVWLGAPGNNTKMTFFAVLKIVAWGLLVTVL